MGPHLPPRAHRAAAADDGFTLVEAVVALFVLGIIFTALAAASLGSLRASMNSRAEQQAIDFATQALESARQADFGSLGHDATDIASDTAVVPCDPTWCFDAGDGGSGPEPVVLIPGGSINPHTRVIASDVNNGVNFKVSTYVTQPSTTGADYRRVTVVARWSIGGNPRERIASSIITPTTRGLPIPLFTFETANNTVAVNPGSGAVYRIVLTNQGAPDRWDLSTNAGSWQFWRDNGDNVACFDSDCGVGVVADTLMVDSDDPDALVDTGRMDPTTTIVFWAVRSTATDTPEGDYLADLTASAVSLDHDGMEGSAGSQSLSLRTRVVLGTVTEPPGPVGPTATVPSAPRALAVAVGDGQLSITWQFPELMGSSPLTGYVIEYRMADQTTWTSVDVAVTDLSRVLTGLENGKVYEVRVAAQNASGTGAFSTPVQGQPTAGVTYSPPSICTDPLVITDAGSGTASAAGGYTLFAYTLHNRSNSNGAWPGMGASPASRTDTQGVPLNMIKDGPEFAAGTMLPVYSADLSTTDAGRVILPGGSFTNPSTSQVVDWRTDTPAKRYTGTALLTLWVAPATGTVDPAPSLQAQFYRARTTDTVMDSSNAQGLLEPGSSNKPSVPKSIVGASWCGGASWQKVVVAMPIQMGKSLAADEYLGIRLWNTGSSPVRIAYDVAGDFPATLVLPEK